MILPQHKISLNGGAAATASQLMSEVLSLRLAIHFWLSFHGEGVSTEHVHVRELV